MRLAILGSGSTGNVALVEALPAGGAPGAGPTRILVDAGLSKSAIIDRLAALTPPVSLDQLDALLITHDHSDHAGCARKLGLPIFAPGATLRRRELEGTRVLPGQGFSIGAIGVMPVLLPHDAAETVGYVLSDGRHRIGILTDCGDPEDAVAHAYAGLDVLVLEANHDLRMLAFGPYPISIQRRVRGARGHLSNEQSATLLQKILGLGRAPALVIAAHRSLKNNTEALVEAALCPHLPSGTRFAHAGPAGAVVVDLPLPRAGEQLSLLSDGDSLQTLSP